MNKNRVKANTSSKGVMIMEYPFPDPRGVELDELSEEVNENLAAMNVSSGQDCTGLIPAAASPSEEEDYSELYDFLPKAVSDGKNDGC